MTRKAVFLLFLLISKITISEAGEYVAQPGGTSFTVSGGQCTSNSMVISSIDINVLDKNNVRLMFSYQLANLGTSSFFEVVSFNGGTMTFSSPTFASCRGNGMYIRPTLSITSGGIYSGSMGANLRFDVGGSQSGSGSVGVSFRFASYFSPTLAINTPQVCSNSAINFDFGGDSYSSAVVKFNNQVIATIPNEDYFYAVRHGYQYNLPGGLADGGTYKLRVEFNDGASSIEGDVRIFTPFSNVSLSSDRTTSCYGQEAINFNVNNVSGNNINYEWVGPESISATNSFRSNNPQNGDYYVKLSKGPGLCYAETNKVNIYVIPNFQVSANPTRNQACDGESIQIDPSPNDPNNYNYSWSNGSSNNSIFVNSNGNYNVTITPKSGGCPGRTSNTINYLVFDKKITNERIEIPAGKTRAVICSNEKSILLSANADDLSNVNYFWTGPKSGNGRTLVADTPGEYAVVIGRGTCVSSQKKITVIGNVVPKLTSSPVDARICNGQTATLTATPSDKNSYTYEWYGGTSGTAIINNQAEPSLKVTAVGTYRLVLKPIGGGCTVFNEVKQNLLVDDNIVGKLNYSGTAVICNNNVGINLVASGTGSGIGFSWNTGAKTSTINIKTAGTYTVTMTRGKCVETQSVIAKNENLTATISAPANIIVCGGSNYQAYELKATSNFSAATFRWKQNNDNTNAPGATSTGSYLPTTAGDYYVIAEVVSLGCTAPSPSNKVKVTVPANFAVNIAPLNPAPICDGTMVKFTATATYASNLLTYQWANTTNKTKELSSNLDGTYTVNIAQEGCKATGSSTITTKPSKPTISVIDDVILSSSMSSDNNYEWFFKALPLSTNPNDYKAVGSGGNTQVYSVDASAKFGVYMVRANRNNCGRTFSSPITMSNLVLSNEYISAELGIKVYPNPVVNSINISDENARSKIVELYDFNNKLIKSWESSEKNMLLHMGDISSGGYYLKIQTNDKKITKKIIKI